MTQIPIDKLIHFLGSYFVCSILMCFMPLFCAVWIVFVLGVAKEFVYDKLMGKGTPEWNDLFADVFGVVMAVVVRGGVN